MSNQNSQKETRERVAILSPNELSFVPVNQHRLVECGEWDRRSGIMVIHSKTQGSALCFDDVSVSEQKRRAFDRLLDTKEVSDYLRLKQFQVRFGDVIGREMAELFRPENVKCRLIKIGHPDCRERWEYSLISDKV